MTAEESIDRLIAVLVAGVRLHAEQRPHYTDCPWCSWAREAAGVIGDVQSARVKP